MNILGILLGAPAFQAVDIFDAGLGHGCARFEQDRGIRLERSGTSEPPRTRTIR